MTRTTPHIQLVGLLILLSFFGFSCQSALPVKESATLATTAYAMTATPAPTETSLPSPSPTAAPVQIRDDFSSQGNIWGECEHCVWKDGALYFGPYPPNASMGEDQLFYVICQACGKRIFYRVAADLTLSKGYGGDRTFGLLAGLTDDKIVSAGTITTAGHALYEQFDFNKKKWGGTDFKLFSSVLRGNGATNHIEVTIAPGSSNSSANITVSVNGTKDVLLTDRPVKPSWAGLYLGWYSVGIKYDNFEYDEIWP